MDTGSPPHDETGLLVAITDRILLKEIMNWPVSSIACALRRVVAV
jgi:hypothetical protein